MPVYTYECESCGERFEARQSFNDEPLTVCPTCEGKLYRVIQPVGIVFKGSGFYVTDSRGKQNLATSGTRKDEAKPANGDGASSGESSAASSDSTGSTGADSKTPSKADAKPESNVKSSASSTSSD